MSVERTGVCVSRKDRGVCQLRGPWCVSVEDRGVSVERTGMCVS